jgi:hypothetical protein
VHKFVTEPQCWHRTGGGVLRPDAYVILRTGNTGECWWLEIDEGTETLPRLRAKLRTYQQFYATSGTGPDGVPPRLLFTTKDQERAHAITSAATSVDPISGADWVSAATHGQAAVFMASELHTTT